MISVDSLSLLASLMDSLRKPSSIHSDDRGSSPDENSKSNSTGLQPLSKDVQYQLQSNGSVSRKPCDRRRYKTELCHKFLLNPNRVCKYGNKCQYAHGIEELRTPLRPQKYKTERCRAFHMTGVCPYGIRCHFVHDESSDKLEEIHQQNALEAETSFPEFLANALRSLEIQNEAVIAEESSLTEDYDSQQRKIMGQRQLCRFV